MPEFRVENFDEGLARLGAHLGEVRKQEGLDMRGKVRAAAAAVGRVANVATFEDIDSRFIRPYLTVQDGDTSRQGSPTPSGEDVDNDDGGGGEGGGGSEGRGDEGALRETALRRRVTPSRWSRHRRRSTERLSVYRRPRRLDRGRESGRRCR